MTQSVDPTFAARIAAYEHNRRNGVVFAADGTVGGVPEAPPRPVWRSHIVRKASRAIVLAMFIKLALFHGGVVAGYHATSQIVLQNSSIWEKSLALILYPDPVSVEVSRYLRIGQQYLAIELRRLL